MSVVIYSKYGCAPCEALKSRLKAKGIEYVEKRIDLSEEDKQFILSLGLRSVPQIFKNGINIKEQDID